MALGRRRREEQRQFWIATQDMPDVPRHVFYEKLNKLLDEGGFDDYVERLCEDYYARGVGRPGIPPGIYFRMLFIGYFEDIGSQRGIAWRCADSLSLKAFLGYEPTEDTPDHSSLTRVRKRLPLEVHKKVFAFVLSLAADHKLLGGKTVLVDATTLEADAAMKSIVRRETGEDWKEYITRLAEEDGVEIQTEEDLRRYDKNRPDKKVSNEQWESSTDPDARITKMKDGRTHLAYKAEHTVDNESEFILDASVYHADRSDADTLLESVTEAQENLDEAESGHEIAEAVADKGYHKNETLADCRECRIRTYIPEPERGKRRWTDKPAEYEQAFRANRRRVRGERSRRLQRQRSERVERSFAHVCETGGARRSWLKGLTDVNKRYKIQAAARNLGLLMRALFGVGKPRCLQGGCGGCFCCFCALFEPLIPLCRPFVGPERTQSNFRSLFASSAPAGGPLTSAA